MEMGKVMSVRPFWGTLATFHDMPMRPMTKLGKNAAAAVTLRMEEFFMFMNSLPVMSPRDLLYILDIHHAEAASRCWLSE
jgi:hypothetical protein